MEFFFLCQRRRGRQGCEKCRNTNPSLGIAVGTDKVRNIRISPKSHADIDKVGGGERAKSGHVYFVNGMLVLLLCLKKNRFSIKTQYFAYYVDNSRNKSYCV